MQPWQKPVAGSYPFALHIQVLGDLARAGFNAPRIALLSPQLKVRPRSPCKARPGWIVISYSTSRPAISAAGCAEALGSTVALINLSTS